MISDFHIHSPYCGHATGKIIHYIESAVSLGLKEIGFADHLGRYYLTQTQKRRYWDWGMNDRDLSRYFAELTDLQSAFEDMITIRIGLEVDYIEGAEDLLEPILKNFSFDFLLGSIHCIPRFGWNHLTEYRSIEHDKIIPEYFRLVRCAISSGLFHSIAHLDFIWRYIQVPPDYRTYIERELDATLDVALEKKMPIEINANGFLWSKLSKGDYNLFIIMLDKISQRSLQITIGSDAHEPGNVGKAFPELTALLRSKAITSIVTFAKGKRFHSPLI